MGIDYQIPKELLTELTSSFKGLSIYLYGSRVTGTHHPDSDVDLLILTKTIPPESEVIRVIELLSENNISAFVMSEKTFDQCRNDSFYFASPLEEVARSGVHLYGNKKIKSLMSDLQVTYGTWIMTLLQLSQRKFLSDPTDAIKMMARATLLTWELENKISLKGNFSLGSFLHSVMIGENHIPDEDELSHYLNESGVLWKWLEDLSQDLSLAKWEEELKRRLFRHTYILDKLKLDPIPLEALRFIQGNPLYANVPWQSERRGNYTMADLGERYLINIIKICLKT